MENSAEALGALLEGRFIQVKDEDGNWEEVKPVILGYAPIVEVCGIWVDGNEAEIVGEFTTRQCLGELQVERKPVGFLHGLPECDCAGDRLGCDYPHCKVIDATLKRASIALPSKAEPETSPSPEAR